MNIPSQYILYVVYLVVSILAVLGNHFFGTPDAYVTGIVIVAVLSNLLGLHIPSPSQIVIQKGDTNVTGK